MSKPTIRVGIVGGTGYTGSELIRILSQHPFANIKVITSRKEKDIAVHELFPSLRSITNLRFSDPDDSALTQCDVVFFATPHGVAMEQAQDLLDKGVRVIDLAADFRIQNLETFEKWYKINHSSPQLMSQAVYGLAEINREKIAQSQLIGLPGCYPTAVQLGFAPLLDIAKKGTSPIDLQRLIADCKSGVSGAGRKAEIGSLFVEAAENFKAYGVSGHRHWPEILQGLETLAGQSVGFTFIPHLVPMMRGIFATLYAPLISNHEDYDFQSLYETFYAGNPFVDVMPWGSHPETKSVRGSNRIRMALHRPPGSPMLVILVVEDNLVKGAAGQGVQCMNLMFGYPETAGLEHIALAP